ncbi:hypothetical protein KP509_02G064900 [Ceratopteris richardii]|uniref:RING-type domain-containing protein n=1 Tax=Ceratopteris richardii TaxID=49495 RepID=A0A8T2VEF2_CERRI|nr:hypothetical protein KP509_02G064900 [Ceratopteris richardii]
MPDTNEVSARAESRLGTLFAMLFFVASLIFFSGIALMWALKWQVPFRIVFEWNADAEDRRRRLQSFPKIGFAEACSRSPFAEEGTDCGICLDALNSNDEVHLLPQCQHAFHVHCLQSWVILEMSCPTCRQRRGRGRNQGRGRGRHGGGNTSPMNSLISWNQMASRDKSHACTDTKRIRKE